MSDVLRRAAAAYAAEPIDHSPAAATRARVMQRHARAQRVRSGLRFGMWLTGASLFGASAMASSTGAWPLLIERVAAIVSSAPARGAQRTNLAPPKAATPVPAMPSTTSPDSPTAVSNVAPAPAPAPAPIARVPRSAAQSHVAVSSPIAPPDRELAAFRVAHDVHFHSGDVLGSVMSWQHYLREFPEGRFAPEAHYNLALALVRSGRVADARAALEPFVAGVYGKYRSREARALLRWLEGQGG